MDALDRPDIQLLLDQPPGQGMVVSCYADLSEREGFASHWLQPFKTEASRLRQRLAGDHSAQQELDRNLAVIRQALESPETRRAQGMAVFSGAERGLFVTVASEEPFPNRLIVAAEPYVVPLIEADLRRRGYLVVLTTTHQGRIYAVGSGTARLLDEIAEAVPRKNRSAGERWGKQQATIARHREDHILHYYKELAERVERRWSEYPYQGLILLGTSDVLAGFRAQLPDRLADQVVDLAPHDWNEGQAEIESEVRTAIDRAAGIRERQVLDDLARRLKEGTAVAAGAQEVIDALRHGQVSVLVLGPDQGAAAWRCPGCRAIFAGAESLCPYCGAPCQSCNLWQEVLRLALNHGIWVELVRPDAELARHGGIAALLARDEPQWTKGPVLTTPGAAT